MLSSLKRETGETSITVKLDLTGTGAVQADTGVQLLDEILRTLGEASGFDLVVLAKGDLRTGDHHTTEDVGITLGSVLARLIRTGIGSCAVAMGECLAHAAISFGEPGYFGDFSLGAREVDGMALENFGHFARSAAYNGRFTLHLNAKGGNDYQKVIAMMTAMGRALKRAAQDGKATNTYD